MTKPIRIQRSRQHKQVSPNGLPVVYVGRPSKWGNEFKVGDEMWVDDKYKDEMIARGGYVPIKIKQVLKLYKKQLAWEIKMKHLDLSELKGKNLSCWCKLGEPCHADILLKLANN